KLPAVALLALVLALTPANSAAAQASSVLDTVPLLERAAMLAEGELSGERALETGAFVAQRWRRPGSSGLQESLDVVVEAIDATGDVPESASAGARLT